MRPMAVLLIATLTWISGACTTTTTNPSFPVTADMARATIAELEQQPVRLDRPLVIMGGWFDPGISVGRVSRELSAVFDDISQEQWTAKGIHAWEMGLRNPGG